MYEGLLLLIVSWSVGVNSSGSHVVDERQVSTNVFGGPILEIRV